MIINRKGEFNWEKRKKGKNTCLFSHKWFKHLNNTSNKNYNSQNIFAKGDNKIWQEE